MEYAAQAVSVQNEMPNTQSVLMPPQAQVEPESTQPLQILDTNVNQQFVAQDVLQLTASGAAQQ